MSIAYYRDGVPFNSRGEPVIVITSGKTVTNASLGDGITSGFGTGLAHSPNSISQTIRPEDFAKNVAQIHVQELGYGMNENNQRQVELDSILSTAQEKSSQTGTAYFTLINPTPEQRAQALVNYQNSIVAELQAKIASEENAAEYIELDIILNNGRIWWPRSQADASQAQQYVNIRGEDKEKVNQLVTNDRQNLLIIQSSMTSVQTEIDKILAATKFTTDFYKVVAAQFSDNAAKIAKEFANAAQGKKLRNVDQALAAFNKYQSVLNKKFGVQDRQAIVNALAALDYQNLSQNLVRYSKALSLVGYGLDGVSLVQVLISSVNSGDYKPFFVKVESMAAGALATELVAWAFAVITGSALGILGFGLLLAVIGALIDDDLIGKINDTLFK